MASQVNLKFPDNLFKAAKRYAGEHGYRNMQELIYVSVREKVFREGEFDESFSEKEIDLIDKIIDTSIRRRLLGDEKDLKAALSK
ncbi:MAG: hypothetical protein AABX01_01775 [Candidatus Micrarchaeota archaeon]